MDDLVKASISEFINRWLPLLKRIRDDESLSHRCKQYNVYFPSRDDDTLLKELGFHAFLKEGYDSGIVVSDYMSFSDNKEEIITHPGDDFINDLSSDDLIRCIAYHFRRDHFCEGSLINESFTDGSLYKLFEALKERL